MNSSLLNRSLATLQPSLFAREQNTRLLHAIQPTNIRFSGRPPNSGSSTSSAHDVETLAHPAGVNAIALDKFEGRYLLSGGADSGISLWDLESLSGPSASSVEVQTCTYHPTGSVKKSTNTHTFGITSLSYYPFDSLAFLSTSYDHALKLYSSLTLSVSASFDLGSVVYSHASSPVATHLQIACATQHPSIRLVDLRSGAATQALAGHAGAVLSVAWSPKDEYLLASGGVDGTVRFWDVRRSAAGLGLLDMEDSVGVLGSDGRGAEARSRHSGRAHTGPVNGVVWTDDGRHVVTTGHDEKIRVWDVGRGANTLASFGPVVKNSHLSGLTPLLVPSSAGATPAGEEILFFPSEREILMFELFEGKMLKRLKCPPLQSRAKGINAGQTNARNRTTALAWREHAVEVVSAHADGTLRVWKPRTSDDAAVDEEIGEEEAAEEGELKEKRKVLEDIYDDVTRKKTLVKDSG